MKTADRPISRRDTIHSIKACHRIEDELWRRLWRLGCTESSDAGAVAAAIDGARRGCPEWCERSAWDMVVESFLRWSSVFGNLRLFAELRRGVPLARVQTTLGPEDILEYANE